MRFITKPLKEIIGFACAIIYAVLITINQKGPRRLVICYHSVTKQDVERFKKQMAYLAKRHRVVKVSEIKSTPANAKDVLVGITFDDAFAGTIDNVRPCLKEHNFDAAVFVPAGNLGRPPLWKMPNTHLDMNEHVMNEEQVAKLAVDGFEVFSHTFSHPVLTALDDDKLRAELVDSKRELNRITGREIAAIGYPYGEYDTRVCNAARRTGYNFGFTIEPQTVDCSPDDMEIGRFAVSPRDSLFEFKLKVDGAYQVVSYLRTIKKRLFRRFH